MEAVCRAFRITFIICWHSRHQTHRESGGSLNYWPIKQQQAGAQNTANELSQARGAS